jgi:hypothetical protein
VGSEMCIRDRSCCFDVGQPAIRHTKPVGYCWVPSIFSFVCASSVQPVAEVEMFESAITLVARPDFFPKSTTTVTVFEIEFSARAATVADGAKNPTATTKANNGTLSRMITSSRSLDS